MRVEAKKITKSSDQPVVEKPNPSTPVASSGPLAHVARHGGPVRDGRASVSGFVIGIGRVGSAAAPLIAGWLFASGLSRGATLVAFGALAFQQARSS